MAEWTTKAMNMLKRWVALRKPNEKFTMTEFRKWWEENKLEMPKSNGSWGSLSNYACKEGGPIIRSNAIRSTAREDHGRLIWVYTKRAHPDHDSALEH